VFRVSRFFSARRTCPGFHRIVSVISPITKEGEDNYKFKKRIFIQYFWRYEKPHDRAFITNEYLDFHQKLSSSQVNKFISSPTSNVSRNIANPRTSQNIPTNMSTRSEGAMIKLQSLAKSLRNRFISGRRQNTSTETTQPNI
ncbi:hypothetical protein DICVIV_04456, partial [Dictyocaulus viviparus]